MSPFVEPLATESDLPERADVVVVGGGIVGCSTAWALAQKGVSVLLCEKGRIGGEQSSRNWGWCRQQGRDIREVPLILESMKIWRRLEQDIEADVGYRQGGVLYIGESEQDMAGFQDWVDRVKIYQLDSRLVTSDELSDLVPGHAGSSVGGLLTPSDGRAEPSRAAPALARAVQQNGGSVITRCAVRGVVLEGGRLSGVVTEHGTVKTHSVVVCGGAWSRLFLGSLGVELPQLKVLSSVMRTAPMDLLTDCAFVDNDFSVRRRQDGGYTIAPGTSTVADIVPDSFRLFSKFFPLFRAEHQKTKLRLGSRFVEEASTPRRWSMEKPSPFEKTRVLDPEPHHPTLDRVFDKVRDRVPFFARASIAERWAGYIDVTPDIVPVISPVDDLPGLTVATGFSGHGFGIGPGAGRLAADLVTGDNPIVDPASFRISRFTDGSPIQFEGDLTKKRGS